MTLPPLSLDDAWDIKPGTPHFNWPKPPIRKPESGADRDIIHVVAAAASKATTTQVGGDHYKKLGIQPIAYIHANKLGFCEGCVVKYISRWREKGGKADLLKAKHFIDLLIELEGL